VDLVVWLSPLSGPNSADKFIRCYDALERPAVCGKCGLTGMKQWRSFFCSAEGSLSLRAVHGKTVWRASAMAYQPAGSHNDLWFNGDLPMPTELDARVPAGFASRAKCEMRCTSAIPMRIIRKTDVFGVTSCRLDYLTLEAVTGSVTH